MSVGSRCLSCERLFDTLCFTVRPLGVGEEAEEDEEVDLQNEDISPHALHLAFNRPRQDVFRVDQSARTLEKVKQTLQVYIIHIQELLQ